MYIEIIKSIFKKNKTIAQSILSNPSEFYFKKISKAHKSMA
jgi:hypothetical protein